jgi:beta-galactosidase
MHVRRFMGALLAGLLVHSAAVGQMAPTAAQASPRERLSLDRGWLFHEGDIPFPVITGHSASYNNAKAGRAWGAADPGFNDSDWKKVDLPHDWAVEQPFDPKA